MSDRTTEIRELLSDEDVMPVPDGETIGVVSLGEDSVLLPERQWRGLRDAARAYADLLDTGPDYEAGAEVYSTQAGEPGWILEATKRVVDAALAAVVDTPKETQ